MPWVKLDDSFWSNPKVEEVGNEAAGAYVRMLSYCGRHLTNGHVGDGPARYITTTRICKRLTQHGFLERNSSGWIIPDYLEYNPSREKAEAKQKARSRAGKKGGVASGQARSKT